jgi:hypothetical protein
MGPQDDLVTQFLPIWLGTPDGPKSVLVSDAQIAYDILSMAIAIKQLDGISKLYAQLLAAKLDIASGADGTVIEDVMEQADAFLANHDPSDWAGLDGATREMVLEWKDVLDSYNNGYIGPGHADDGSVVVDCDDSGCPPCVVGISFSGCAFDFNLWGSSYNETFGADRILVGEQMTPLALIPGFSDTFEGIEDPYGHPFDGGENPEPNLSNFTPIAMPGATYNIDGLILPGTEYGNTYTGSRVYEGNGIQFSADDCGENEPPTFEPPVGYIYDTIIAQDFDPDDIVTIIQIAGPGEFSSTPGNPPVYGYFTWTPTESGSFAVVFEATDNHGASVIDSIIYQITFNAPPEITTSDTAFYSCWGVDQICLTISATDNEGDVLTYNLLSGFGVLDPVTGELCFTPDGPGEYPFEVEVTDTCGADTAAFVVTLTLNNDPWINPYDTIIEQCGIDSICFEVTASDPDPEDSLEITHISGPGVFTQTGNGVGIHCFLPDSVDSARYVFYYSVTDDCWREEVGLAARPLVQPLDSVVVIVVTGQPPVITCPDGVQTFLLCGPDSVCVDIPVDPSTANIEITGPGAVYDNGRLCFYAEQAGIYNFTMVASNECGSDTCEVTVDVSLDAAPQLTCPPSGAIHLCGPDSISVPLTFAPASTELTIDPPASYADGMLTFYAGQPGEYCFEVIGSNSCGEDTCSFCISVTFDSPPEVTIADTVVYQCDFEEVCLPYSFSDPDNNVVSVTVSAMKDYLNPEESEGEVCFLPDGPGINELLITVTDACGNSDVDTATIIVALNQTPLASLDNESFYLCEPDDVCFPLFMYDMDGVIDSVVVMAPAYYDAENQQVCLPVEATGLYQVTAVVYDDCGAYAIATAVSRVIINYTPEVIAPADTALFQCTLSEICLDGFEITDRNRNFEIIEFIPDIGTYSDGQYCFTPQEPGEYCFIVRATDSCGAYDEDTVCVTVELGDDVAITCPEGIQVAGLCGPDSVCVEIPIEPATALIEVIGPGAAYEEGKLCFFADESGRYSYTVIATGDCGADTCQVDIDVTVDEVPQITCPPSDTLHLCGPDSITVPLTFVPASAELTINPPATYVDGMLTFFAEEPGDYCFEAVVNNTCGADTCNFCITVTFDSPPQLTVTDSSVFLCEMQEICVPVSYSDPDGNIANVILSPTPLFELRDGQVCLTADAPGIYEYSIQVTDSCGMTVSGTGTIELIAKEGPSVSIDDGSFPLCEAGEVCLPLTISDPDNMIDTITVTEPAYYDADRGVVCLNVSEPGVYQIGVTIYDICGLSETIVGTATVDIGPSPQLACPPSQAIHLCQPDTIALPLEVSPQTAQVTINPPAVFEDGLLKFYPEEEGEYCFEVIADTDCGSDTCNFCITVTFDSPPVVTAIDTSLHLCSLQTICIPANISDPDDNIAAITVSAGFELIDGEICFTPDGAGAYMYWIAVIDSCEKSVRDSGMVVITLNQPPVASVGDDSLFLCGPTEICLPVTFSDPDGIIDSVITAAPWYYDADRGVICRTVTETGTYHGAIWVYDDCGVMATEMGIAEVTINSDPVVTLPADTAMFLCEPQEICIPVEYSDPNGNITDISISPAEYELIGGTICFTPTTSGSYEIIVTVTDSCDVSDADTIMVTVDLNQLPQVSLGDTTLFSCDSGNLSPGNDVRSGRRNRRLGGFRTSLL